MNFILRSSQNDVHSFSFFYSSHHFFVLAVGIDFGSCHTLVCAPLRTYYQYDRSQFSDFLSLATNLDDDTSTDTRVLFDGSTPLIGIASSGSQSIVHFKLPANSEAIKAFISTLLRSLKGPSEKPTTFRQTLSFVISFFGCIYLYIYLL